MKQKKKLILQFYIRDYSKFVVVYVAVVLAFFSIAGLYGYQQIINNMFYAVFLTAFFGLCAACIHFFHYQKRCLQLMEILEKKSERDNSLPQDKGLIDRLYQEIICAEEQEKRGLITECDQKTQDMADYYTMWIHQIKTPIAALRLLLEQRDNQEIPKTAVEELFKIEQYAEMALHYARLDSLSSDLLFKMQDIEAIVKRAVKKYSILFIRSGLSFSMEEFDCKAITDEKWLGFVIEQFLSNALKYTTKGGISIYGLNAQLQKAQKDCCYVVIEDTGIGIGESDLPRIFERGFTGYNGRMNKKSTGIGLYLCRQILDKLSHNIIVESKVGEGTRVLLDFRQQEIE